MQNLSVYDKYDSRKIFIQVTYITIAIAANSVPKYDIAAKKSVNNEKRTKNVQMGYLLFLGG